MQSTRYKKFLYIVMLILCIVFGAYTANLVYRYQVVVNGMLGIATLYLMFRKHSLSNDGTIEELLLQTNKENFKGFFYLFASGFLGFLSFMVIAKMLSTLL